MVSSTAGPAQQLAEVLAVLASSQGEDTAAQRGLERIAECFDAEVGALVNAKAIAAVIGFPVGKVPTAELLEAAAGQRQHLDLPGAGEGTVVTVPVERETDSSIVLVRSGGQDFDPEEVSLLRGMAKVLALALRMLRMVDTIQQSEEHSRAILRFADDAFISMDSDGRVTAWNEKAMKTFGWSESEAIGSEMAELVVPPRHRRAHREGLSRFLATGEGPVLNQRIETTAWREDGIEIPVEMAIWPVSSNGTWTFSAFVRDISERRRAEEALRRNERRLADAQEIARLGSWEWTTSQNSMSWSDQLYSVFGRPAGTVASLEDFISSVHSEDRELVDQALRTASESAERFELECRVALPEEAERVVHVRGEPVLDGGGLLVGFRGTGQDVTEITRAERETDRLATELRLLLESAAEGIWGVDVEGSFTFINRAAAQMFGWAPEEMIGKNAHLMVHHSRPDGSAYPAEDCPTFRSFRSGEGHRIDGEVLWRRDGTAFPTSYASFPIEHDGVLQGAVITCSDITERQKAADALSEANLRLQQLASSDALTGLPNRALFSDRLDQALALARREQREVAVLFIDLDRFKDVNDSLGHHTGDDLLVEVSHRLTDALRDSDTVARLGGDEFAVLLGGTASPEEAAAAAERILTSFRRPFTIGGVEFMVSASVGVALWPEDCRSKAELLQHADVAMYRSKAAGGNRFEMFQPAMTVAARDRLTVEREMRLALEAGRFFLRYHPQVELATGAVVGVEALVRWEHPRRGEVMPLEFIELAEETGLIVPIGAWVLMEACRQAARWRVELAERAPLRMAVNVSPRQLANADFVAQVEDSLAGTGLAATDLELEITESTLISETGPAAGTLKTLRQLGISVAIDDFGSGYSSLGHLRRFPVDRLKLDMSFVAGLGRPKTCDGRHDETALVAAAVDLAHALGIQALAEGVETEDQRLALVAIGAEEAQGYLWTRPLRSDEFTEWLGAQAT
ncbi:MAG TPA: EAL domain-containing protein [Acidimicrobiales bacterium]|nr:EAL domain-containing protein [Acidimicrobiales bacterium]